MISKNWKTSLAFFIFIGLLIYSVVSDKNIEVVSWLVILCIITWSLMKSSSETLNTFVTNISGAIKNKWSKG